MRDILTLAKAIIVPGFETLSGYDRFYHPDIDMYIFDSVAYYDTQLGKFSGVMVLHDRIIQKYGLGALDSEDFNYLSVDLDRSTWRQTYMTVNRRGYLPTEEELRYLERLYDTSNILRKR